MTIASPRSTYRDQPLVIGGIQVGRDGKVHTTFGHNPSTLRLCSFDPNLQNIPRGSNDFAKWVKECFVAEKGHVFWARDYSGIEAVLVGYFAGARDYYRLAKRDVHSFYTIHALHELDGTWSANDLPDLGWDDERLFACLKEVKKEFKEARNNLYKHLVHGANFMQSPQGSREKIFKETGNVYDVATIARIMGVYFDLFPEIRKWHKDLCKAVDGTKKRELDEVEGEPDPWSMGVCYARNPFGYVHHFYNVLNWEKIVYPDGSSEWLDSFGDDAKRLVAFLPQSTAAAVIKKSAKTLWYDHFAVGYTLRLLIHDETLGECREEDLDECLRVSAEVMESPMREMPLDPAWGMGEFLTLNTEAKFGPSWGEMH